MKKNFKTVTALLLALCMTLGVFCMPGIFVASAADDGDYAFTAAQDAKNYRTVSVSVPALEALKSDGKVDSITVNAKMYYKGEVRQTAKAVKELSALTDTGKTLSFDVPFFGKWMVSATYTKNGTAVYTTDEQQVGVVAEKYNIAPISATTPVLIFSMKMFYDESVIKTAGGDPVPSIVQLQRTTQYDWSKLPENVYTNPFLTKSEVETTVTLKKWNIAAMHDYVVELHELDPDSHFVFIINDFSSRYTLAQLAYTTNLPDGGYSIIFVTDGSATYSEFRKIYGGTDDAQAVHNKLVAAFTSFRDEVRNDANYGFGDGYSRVPFEDGTRNLRDFVYAAVEVENAKWWVIRRSTDTFEIQDTTFLAKLTSDSRVSNNYLNGLLSNLQAAGKDGQFKDLYKFDDTAFQATRAKGKKIMMILGTSKAAEGNNPIDEFVNFTQLYFGDGFEYYYKGHPGWIIEGDKVRLAKMEALNMQALDSSIAAELFGFYNPDIYISGYQSTTFQSIGTDETVGGIYATTKASAYSSLEYAGKVKFFMTDMSVNVPSSDILALRPYKYHHNYLIEYNKSQSDTDIGIYDADIGTLYMYSKDSGGAYKLTEQKYSKSEQTIATINKQYGDKAFVIADEAAGYVTYSSSKTSVATVNSAGKVSIKAPGTTYITISTGGNATTLATTVKIKLVVAKGDPALKFYYPKVTKTYGNAAFTNKLSSKTDGKVTYSSSDKKVATVDAEGKVTIKGAGTAKITAKSAKTTNYDAGTATFTVTVKKAASTIKLKAKTATYTGKAIKVAAATKTGSKGKVTYTYYTDSACKTKTTKAKNGASSTGAAPVKAGTYYVKATVAADANYNAKTSAKVKLVIKKAGNKITAANITKNTSAKAQTVSIGAKALGGAKLSYKSGNSKVKVSSSGKVTIPANFKGTVKITITAAATDNYLKTTKTIKITVK